MPTLKKSVRTYQEGEETYTVTCEYDDAGTQTSYVDSRGEPALGVLVDGAPDPAN